MSTHLQQPVSSGSCRVWPWQGGVLRQAPLSPEPRACQRSLPLAKHQSALQNRPAQKILLFWGLGELPNDLVGLLLELKSLPLSILVKKAFHSSLETDERKSLFDIRRSNFNFLDRTKFQPVTDCNWVWMEIGWHFLPCGGGGSGGSIPKAEALPSLCQWDSRLMFRGQLWLLTLLA